MNCNKELKQLLEELRVALPGIQILFAFLLTVPFNQRFERVRGGDLVLFGIALSCTFIASVLLIAPSIFHRLHFGASDEEKAQMLPTFNRLAIAGSIALALAITSSLTFLADFLFGSTGGLLAAIVASAVCTMLWYVLPLMHRRPRAA